LSLWIKICANTSLADARLAVQAGADAVGFVFAPSPRRVTPKQVVEITPRLPASVEKIGVFVDADCKDICAAVLECGLTGVQLHSGIETGLSSRLRQRFGESLRILRVVHFGPGAASEIQRLSLERHADALLVDSRTAMAVGGTGVAFDWEAARDAIFTRETPLRLVAAGGLNPENVGEAIATLRPWGVDVASGVESEPGRKDAAKVWAFVEQARRAADLIASEP
jgi:phosphoribosylanthranilate isomerase